MEIYCPKEIANGIIALSESFNIAAQITGYVEKSDKTFVNIIDDKGQYEYLK